MGINPIEASEHILEKYLRYIDTTFFIKNKYYREQFKHLLDDKQYFAKGPYLDVTDSFEKGKSIEQLIDEGIVSKEFRALRTKKLPLDRLLHKHQEEAFRKASEGKNLVVSTGTGSGKTESFLLPIMNHLMQEKEKGHLCDGVRALIIYPMNALANDQLKRLREVFANYSSITFGAYTGETAKEYSEGLAKFKELNHTEPLPNERIDRATMTDHPPHILITNYAMLEYLMLRPKDNTFFDGKYADYWKYIILDEAHTYTGATGIEVSMLLRRVVNRLRYPEQVQFILTSATLGGGKEDDGAIVDFARRLCCEKQFDSTSIVRASRCAIEVSDETQPIKSNIYGEIRQLLANKSEAYQTIKTYLKSEGIELEEEEETTDALLYKLILTDKNYYKLKQALKEKPLTVHELSREIGLSDKEIVDFVDVASKVSYKNIDVLDARYHMFIRALEGAYITLPPYKSIEIIPKSKKYINNREHKVFKICVCMYCGQIYIEGYEEEGVLVQKKEYEQKGYNSSYMLIDEEGDIELDEDDDQDSGDDIYELCGCCGRIRREHTHGSLLCTCGREYINRVKKVTPKKDVLHKCSACGVVNTQGSITRGFYLGQEATASVIGTSLYEEIPNEEKHKKEIKIEIQEDEFGLGGEDYTRIEEEVKELEKQFLIFSDSRQEAAYFASYFGFTYNNIIRRRLLLQSIYNVDRAEKAVGVSIQEVVDELALLLETHKIVKPEESLKEAWKSMMYEISSDDRNSLESLGLIAFEYQGREKGTKELTSEEFVALQRVLVNGFRRDCKLKFDFESKMQKADREFYKYKALNIGMCLEYNDAKGNAYVKSWQSSATKANGRANYIQKILDYDLQKANRLLGAIWTNILMNNGGLELLEGNSYHMSINQFKIKSTKKHQLQWYMCDKCGRLTRYNIKDRCPSSRCDGILEICDMHKQDEENHYRRQYNELKVAPMIVKEHTAQLSPKTARLYQEDFVNKKINVLSCSTTFEMGVDVGELETVFMKNMPPSPANYAQRAGRAGRRKDSAAYALTFCRLSSHDLTYFNKPRDMIRGKISPPRFEVANQKIIKRHVNAAILGSFWKRNHELFDTVEKLFSDVGYRMLEAYIQEKPESLLAYIKAFVPVRVENLVKQWMDELMDRNSPLTKAYEDYKTELQTLEQMRNESARKAMQGEIGESSKVTKLDFYIKKMKEEGIIAFLSKKNIIPKYGFPVDTVELTTSFGNNQVTYGKGDSKLRLQRDLMIAISEYAPGSQVIADGEIYTSQYIKRPGDSKKYWDQYDYGSCENPCCGHLNIRRHLANDYEKEYYLNDGCEICKEQVKKQGTFIIPEYGFIINNNVEAATTKKPQRTYRGEIHYVGDKLDKSENLYQEHLIGNKYIKIQSTADDELVVLNKSNFYVCETCGYAVVNEKKGDPFIVETKSHETSFGKTCSNKKLFKKSLGHKFKTDVVGISFGENIEHKRGLSILYALLEGISQYLGIERNDISGCLHYITGGGNWETQFILFDTVPGGAGHVRRIGKADTEGIKELIRITNEIVIQCNCGGEKGEGACYSCLCNYYNQKHHEDLQRKYVIDFLEELVYNS